MRIQGPSGQSSQIPQGDYTVQQGDTLSSLASKFGITPDALAKANNLAPGSALSLGQSLNIPKTEQSTIQQGIASFQDKFEQVGSPMDALKQAQPQNMPETKFDQSLADQLRYRAAFELPNIALQKQKSAFDKGDEIHVKESGPIFADSNSIDVDQIASNLELKGKILKGSIGE